jgi:F-box/leucine-rich repeat protein 2/20
MDTALCDDLLLEVFGLLPPSAAPAVSLVSRRWLALLRAATSSLSLRLPASSAATLAALLSHYPFLTALTLVSAGTPVHDADAVLLAVAAAPAASCLSTLRLLPDWAVSPAALLAACPGLSGLTSLHLTAVRPLVAAPQVVRPR